MKRRLSGAQHKIGEKIYDVFLRKSIGSVIYMPV